MNNRNLSNINSFIDKMGGSNNVEKIPVVYLQDTEEVIIEKNGKITDRKKRYTEGEEFFFKCKECGEIISKGKKTNENLDKIKIYCFKCKKVINLSGYIILKNDPLWHKPENKFQRETYEKILEEYIKGKELKILEC